ncbi:MAG: hypothetical protein V7722_00265 [Porticoccus sp.]
MDIIEKHTGFTLMALEVTDLHMPITEGSVVLPAGVMFLFVRDPDKNVIEFHQVAS